MTTANAFIEGNLIGEVPHLPRQARGVTANLEQAARLSQARSKDAQRDAA